MSRRNLEFSCAVLLIGIIAGLAGMATTLLLHAVEHLAYAYSFGTLLDGVDSSSPVRRVLAPTIGGALAGLGWWMLRRRTAVPELAGTISQRRPIPRIAMSLDAALQVLLVGSGASLGREGAPRQLAAAGGDAATSRLSLTPRDREILLACAAGAGLAAVYSVPLGGALFAAKIMLDTWHPRALGTALITSSLAVAVAAPVTHLETPLDWPDPSLSVLLTVLAVLLAPLAVGVGAAFNRLMTTARPARAVTSWTLVPAVATAGLLVGICSLWWPELPGNGKSVLEVSLNSGIGLGSAAAILLLKPLLTAAYLKAGAVGGMLTPALATGAAAGALVALAINTWTQQSVNVPAVSLLCAAGVLAITQRAPLWAAFFVWELARPPWWLLIVFMIAAVAADRLHRLWRLRVT
ncbi:chloride channel protein [Mycolicibacterium sp. S2-37]|uniref:chloride channel protein n=1 Tax=Mycolicibacterium sp. S2-37 TaxID=2810297 RepID=UPI001A93DE02|nr:chloride channel protein [Mycolicibacterium sp. S2-37]MBO0679566.1 chloride channel protein [Mycolicibacterium sp. S2-37]